MDGPKAYLGALAETPGAELQAPGGAPGLHGAVAGLQDSQDPTASVGVFQSSISSSPALLESTGLPAVGLAALPGPPGPVVRGKTSYTALPGDADNLTAEKEAYRELRRRARAACRICGLRKVRCDVTKQAFGEPCTNCRRDGLTCAVLPRKKHRPRRPNGTFDYGPASVSPLDANIAGGLDNDPDGPGGLDGPISPSSPGLVAGIKAASPEVDGRLPDDDISTYMGDNRGPRQSVYDLCHPLTPQEAHPQRAIQVSSSGRKAMSSTRDSREPRHTAAASYSAWSRHEATYLNHQGAFTPFSPRLLDDIYRVYFAHVHFFLPVLDVDDFIGSYNRNGWNSIDPLLGWSMCLAAANFVPDDVLSRAGFKTRKEMKEAMYARAKCLYDLDKDTDKVTLIQSVLLIGFWYTDARDHTGAWHWIGVAISLAQSLGFHRSPQLRFASTRNPMQKNISRDRTARRIWWTCLVRDRWVALAKGRPMRIHDEDCDVPIPLQEDLLHGYDVAYKLQHSSNILLPPKQAVALSSMWLRLVTISGLLGRIVRSHYRVQGPRPTQQEIEAYEREIQLCRPKEDEGEDVLHGEQDNAACQHILLHQKHTDLFYLPYLLQATCSLSSDHTPQWHRTAASRARAAAASTNDVLSRLIELQAVHLLKPMTITAFVPAMQIHLFDCKAESTLLRNHGKNKLDLCLLVLSEMRNTYWSASVIYRLFSKAQKILEESSSRSSKPGHSVEITTTNIVNATVPEKTDIEPVAVGSAPYPTQIAEILHRDTQPQPYPLRPPAGPQHSRGHLKPSKATEFFLHNEQATDRGLGYSRDDVPKTASPNNYMNDALAPAGQPPDGALAQQSLPASVLPSDQYGRLGHLQKEQSTSYHQTPFAGVTHPHPEGSYVEAVPTPSNWWGESHNYRGVDHLLSPGFSLSDDIVQGLFQNFDESITGPDIDMMYMPEQSHG